MIDTQPDEVLAFSDTRSSNALSMSAAVGRPDLSVFDVVGEAA